VRVLAGEISPFSFGRSIYLNPDLHPGPELAAVLRHELVHVRQRHTLDVLLAQLALAAAWCNPAAWLLRRALLDNLEFLADQAVLETGLDRRAYQYSLLRLSQSPAGPALVSHFTFPTLKNRVVMMNMPLSSSGQLARYFVAGPLVLAVALGISGARAQGAGPVVPAARVAPLSIVDTAGQTRLALEGPADYYLDGTSSTAARVANLPQAAIASIRWLKAETARTISGSDKAVYVITTKARQNAPEVVAFNQKVAALSPSWISFDDVSDPVLHDASLHQSRTAAIAPTAKKATVLIQPKPTVLPTLSSTTAAKAAPRTPGLGNGLSKPNPVIYLDGQHYTGDLNSISPQTIANISVFKGEDARRQFGAEAADGVIVITTTARQNDADVRAFNERTGAGVEKPAAPAPAPAGVPYLAAPALAYITQHYPAARLLGVAEVPAPDGGPARYQAQIVIGRRPAYLLFDAAGQFISESTSRDNR
jgi:hypothetical protein